MRLDIGVASYRNPVKLKATLESIEARSVTDWRCFIIHNPSEGDAETRAVIGAAAIRNPRFVVVWMERNEGYAGAVNELFSKAETDYIAYCDNDVEILTDGWDEKLCRPLKDYPEIGQVFPGSGHYGFFNGQYHECLWNAGYCWVLRRCTLRHQCLKGGIDTSLGHHEEVDLMIRLRLGGFSIACRPDVSVIHHETATNANAADHQPGGRIHDGVVRWMNKWNLHFVGDQITYTMTAYDPRALRYTDWNVCALYIEKMTLAVFPEWNKTPRTVNVPGVGEMDVIEVLKPKGPYAGRAI